MRNLLSRLLRPWPFVPLTVFAVGAVELAVANRKYGVFTGGFGQSTAVDTPGEVALFLAAYAVSQLFAALLAWKVAALFSRKEQPWRVMIHFAFVFAGLSLFALTAQYQLHSYFSDAVNFALLRQLGGGSLTDALLFGKNEIALALGAVGLAVLAWWAILKLLARLIGDVQEPRAARRPPLRWIGMAGLALAAMLVLVPRAGNDAARGLDRMLAWRAAENFAALATDFDGDGYGLVGRMVDTHPFDPSRHPLALDIPGNGVDEDGYGGDLVLVPVPEARPPADLAPGGPHVVVVVLESTRADVIGKRIDGKPVAPNLEAIAAEGSAIVPAYSHTAFTTASLKSIFAGALAPQAGDPSLFRELGEAGYRIGVISGQPEDFGDISETVAMRENADVFVDAELLKDQRAFSFAAQGSLLVDEAILMQEFTRHFGRPADWQRPVFLYVNFQSPHFPYHHDGVPHVFADPPLARGDISAANRPALERTYWNAVHHSDAHLGALVDQLRSLGVWDNTILIVTGDHGEALFEDGFLGHGHVINDRQYATFLASNRPLSGIEGPIALSDYRAILLDLMQGREPALEGFAPFMHIGDLDAPSAIGLADPADGLVSLRLDTGETCFARSGACKSFEKLEGAERALADRAVARWGSERWAVHIR